MAGEVEVAAAEADIEVDDDEQQQQRRRRRQLYTAAGQFCQAFDKPIQPQQSKIV